MIEVQNVSRRYGDFTAVDGISFDVMEGEIVGILGPNGAGKTTSIRMITGFLPPSSGRVTVYGKDLFAEPGAARRDIGYLPENVSIYPEMRVREYLEYRARIEGMKSSEAKPAIAEAIERCLLAEVKDQIVGTLSKGYRQRVGLAAAIVHKPRVLVLDEPTVGLDPKQIIAIRELIRELGRNHTLLLSTHILPEVELLCRRVLIIDKGRIIAQGTPADLRERWLGNAVLRVALKGDGVGAAESLATLPGVASVKEAGLGQGEARFTVECERGADPREAVFRAAIANGWVLLGLRQDSGSLEDVFVRLTTQDNIHGDAVSETVSTSDAAAADDAAAAASSDNEVIQ